MGTTRNPGKYYNYFLLTSRHH